MRTEEFHSSPSDINLFLDEPALWFVKQFIGYRTEVGAAAHRGTAVEYGLAAHLFGVADPPVLAQTVPIVFADNALQRYRQLTVGEISDDIEGEAKNISPMLAQATSAFTGLQGLIQWQRRIDVTIEGIPIFGFLDFVYPDCLVDLKTTKAVPTKPRPGHVRQMALYTLATGLPARLCYVSAKKFLWHDISEAQSAAALRQVQAACRAMRRIRAFNDWRAAAEFYPPRDLDSYFYDDVARHIATELWSL